MMTGNPKKAAWRGALVASVILAMLGIDARVAHAEIEEIIVTARKREESSRDIPVAVTTLTRERLGNYDITTLEDVAAVTPQLVIYRSSSGSGAEISLRGIGSTPISIGIDQSVAVNIDGVAHAQGRVINEGLFDSRQLEILRGPQALFFGKNSPAGVISIMTNDPGDTFEAIGKAGWEFRARELLVETILSGPITENLGARLALRATDMSGGLLENEQPDATYVTIDAADFSATPHFIPAPSDRDLSGAENYLGRLTLMYTPTEDLTLKLKGSASRLYDLTTNWTSVLFDCPFGGGFAQSNPSQRCKKNWKAQHTGLPPEIAETDALVDNEDGELYNQYNSFNIAGTAEYSLPNVELTSVLGYFRSTNEWEGDFDGGGAASVWAGEDTRFSMFSAELRALTTFDGPLNFLLGAYYQDTERDFLQNVIFAGSENSAVTNPQYLYTSYAKDSETDGETFSWFTQALYEITPELELTAGVRFTHETKDSHFVQPYVNPFLLGIFVPNLPFADDQTFDNWSPELTLTWKPTDEVMVYGALKRGYKSGGFSISAIIGTSSTLEDFIFEPEDVKGAEAGIKTLLFDRTLALDLTAFHYDYEDLQVDFFNTPTFNFITENAAEARMDGVELEATWVPAAVEGLTVRGSLAYNKTEYDEFIAPCHAGQTPAEGCVLSSGPPSFTPKHDISGEPTAHAPEWTASLGFDYRRPVFNDYVFGLSVDTRYSDEYNTHHFAVPGHEQDAYVNWDAALRFGRADDRWQLALIGRNLTNEWVLMSSLDAPLSGGDTGLPTGFPGDKAGTVGMPRTIQLQLMVRY